MASRSSGRVAVFTASLTGGGGERAMVHLATGIAERGHPVDLVIARAGDAQRYADELSADVRVVALGAPRAARSVPALVRYLRRERPAGMVSAIDYTNVLAVVAARLARTGCPVVVSEQNTLSVESGNARRARDRVLPALARRAYPLATAITAVSAGVADDLAETLGLDRERVVVVPNPVVVPGMAELARGRCDEPWLQPGHRVPVALAVGRLSPQKDYDTLIRALAKVRQCRPARVLVLGEGPERPRLEALAAELGVAADVRLAGWVDNAYAYLARADAFVLSSRWEGLPTVLIEALFCGVPVVSTDCPSGPQEILDGGRYGRLVPVRDVAALAAALAAALDGSVPVAGPESWRRYEREAVVDRYLDLLGAWSGRGG